MFAWSMLDRLAPLIQIVLKVIAMGELAILNERRRI
jgi:hypothetical protein